MGGLILALIAVAVGGQLCAQTLPDIGPAYTGGEIAAIPSGGGVMPTGSSHRFDAVFDLGLEPAAATIPATMPLPVPTYGWNLGNTMEPPCGAGCWGPLPAQALFTSAANAGFNAVRIPCAWDSNATTNGDTYQIKPTYMAQVKQVVDWAIAAGMYVVINDHWDDGWLENNIGTTVGPIINAKMNAYWTQIATAFAGYDNHLLFAAANEPNVSNPEEMDALMVYYQTFVNAVRAAGGSNTNRWLVLQGGGDTSWLNSFPTDSTSNRLMVEYHCYTPSLFTIEQSDQSWGNMIYFWGPAYHYSGDPPRSAAHPEEGEIDSGFQQLTDQYVRKGMPVMIGEFGAAAKSFIKTTNTTEAAWNGASVHYWDKYVAESARVHGLSPFYWSAPGNPFDWKTGAVDDSQTVSELTGGVAPPPPNGAPYAAAGLTAIASNNQVTLSWIAGSGATSYNLYRAAESGYESASPVVTGITGTTYTDTNLNSGATYYYQVVAVNGSGPSGFSLEARATMSGINPDPAQFNFETDAQRWFAGGSPIAGIATSTAQRFAGNQSLAVNFKDSAAGSSSVCVQNAVVGPGQTITFHVWVPHGSQIATVQPYLQDYSWNWTSSWYGGLATNAWNTITLTVPPTAVAPFQNLGITFTTRAGLTNTCYIDSVTWNTPAPDFILSANPTTLTVRGGTKGTSAITVTPTNGLNGCYTLSASGLPSGVTAAFATNPMIAGASMLTFTASNTVTAGTSNVTITATSGLISHSTTIAFALNAIAPSNTPPTLSAIANQTVNPGQTVAFTASATDTDQPPQTLTFALLAGATNAILTQVNNTNASFSFRPLVTQASSTNHFTITVADNGAPSLSATKSFSIIVNPLSAPGVSNISASGAQIGFKVSGQGGPDYAIEISSNLTLWTSVFITNSPMLPFIWTDGPANLPQRFYRIKLGPPLP